MFMLDRKDFKYLVNTNIDRDLLYKISVHLKSTMNRKGWGFIYREDYSNAEWWDIIQYLKKRNRRGLYK